MNKLKNIPLRLRILSTLVMGTILVQPLLRRLESHDPFETNLINAKLAPGTNGFILGTDNLGRCVLCRILEGGCTSLYAALAVVLLAFLIGTTLGMVSGYCGGIVDAVIGKVTTVFQAFPNMILAIAVAGILGQSLQYGIWALVAAYWTTYARLSRSMVLTYVNADYVKAAKLCGANSIDIIRKYIFPNVAGQMVVTAALDIGSVILSMATLSFLGLGAKRPTAEWGAAMSEAKDYLQVCPWMVIMPGIALFIIVFLFNQEGDALRDYLDKKGK